MSACRHRVGEILSFVDQEGPVVGATVHRLVEELECPQGHPLNYAALLPYLDEDLSGHYVLSGSGNEWIMDGGRPPSVWEEYVPPQLSPLRVWQVEALDAWASHGRHGVIQAVTGTGKSRVGVEAIREALRHDYSVVIVVPTIDLVEQWRKTLRSHGITAAGVAAEGARPSFLHHQVVLGTVQSLYLSPPERADGKVLLVADECHRYGAEQWRKVLHPSYRRRLGLTATFERNDDGLKALERYFGGPHVYEIGFGRAIADDIIAPYHLDLVPVSLEPDERHRYDEAHEAVSDARVQLVAAGLPAEPFGEFLHAVQRASREDEPDWRLRDVARRYLASFSERTRVLTEAREKVDATIELAPLVRRSRGTLVFTRRREMAETLADVLRSEDVAVQAVHSGLGRVERQERLSQLRAGQLRALVAPMVLDEGVDVPDVDLGIVVAGSKSRRQMTQRMGRVLRRKKDGRAARFIFVYARETVEDLSQESGAVGCLDLLVEHARTSRTVTAQEAAREVLDSDQFTVASVWEQPSAVTSDPEPGLAPIAAAEVEAATEPVPVPDRLDVPTGHPLVDALSRLADLRREGLLTDEEFGTAKRHVLGRAD